MKTNDPRSWWKKIFSAPYLTAVELQANAEREGPEAQNNLGILFLCCDRFETDSTAAAQCFRTAAEQGHSVAQYNLGVSYEQGRGVVRDRNEAQKWFLKAAEQGDGSAQFHLGVKLHRDSVDPGNVATEDCKIEALKWLLLAAAQGHHNAETSCNTLILRMSHLQLEESNRRVAAFNKRALEPG